MDKVLLVSPYPESYYENMKDWELFFGECRKLVHDWHEEASRRSKPFSPNGRWREVFWRTMTADRYYQIPKGEVIGNWRRANIEDVHKFEELESKLPQWGDLNEAEKIEVDQYFDQIYIASFRRKFFLTKSGHMGFGNPQVGDEVWVLFGGRVSFVLRPNEDGSTFSMIGDCYLHGFMDGEAMVDVETKTRTVVLT